jgi:hypothetical protein
MVTTFNPKSIKALIAILITISSTFISSSEVEAPA